MNKIKCAFCKKEPDYKIQDLNDNDKEFCICAKCLLNVWIPMVKDIYKTMKEVFDKINYEDSKQDEFNHQLRYR